MSRAIELALKKQRLQFESAALRQALVQDVAGVAPLIRGVDRIRSGLHWLRTRPYIVAGVSVALLVARPRAAFRWARRAYFAFRALRGLRSRLVD